MKRCNVCDRPIAGPHSSGPEGLRCERCHLRNKADATLGDGDSANVYVGRVVEALAAALDAREHETGLHSQRVACHTMILARRVTQDPARLRQIYWGSLLHDIGKIAVPDSILLKKGPLGPAEWDVMRTHPDRGRTIVEGIPFMEEAADIVYAHEERFDGTGYPRGLRGSEIPAGARIFAVIDALDAMTSDRPYRHGLAFDLATKEIERTIGTQFDPWAVELFREEEEILREMVEMKCAASEVSRPNPRWH